MKSVGPRGCTRVFRVVVAFACILTACSARAWAAGTAAGIAITNTASAVFTDINNTASTTTSNTLSTTVQNAPALTVGASNQNVTIGMVVVDTFTLTNVGNGTGSFALPGNATFAGTATGTTLQGYVLNAATTGTCSNATPCAYAILNAQSGMSAIAAGSVTVGVEYTVSASAALAQTILTTLTASLTNAALSGAVAESSANSTATPTDTITADARLDVQTYATPAPTGGNITWKVSANNGGGFAARDLQAAQAVLGASVSGIVLFAKIPTFANGGSLLAVAPTVSTCPSGSTCTVYYNTTVSASPTTGWTTTQPGTLSATTWAAVFISGGTVGVELVPASSGSTGAGNVSVPQVAFSFATTQPSGAGSTTANAVTLIANSAIGGQLGMSNVIPIIGNGVTIGTADAASAAALTGIESNAVASSGTTPPGGASNITGSVATVYSIFVGPNGQAQASGAWSTGTYGYTTGSATVNNDFTFVDYDTTASVNAATAQTGFPTGNSIANAGAATIIGTVQNGGNVVDTITLSATSVSPWTVTFYCYNATLNGCGASSGGASTCSTVALASNQIASLASLATLNFCATFSTPPTNVTALSAIVWTITATSTGNGGTNTTYDVLYPGGVLAAFRTAAVTGPGNCSTKLISGCTITYTAYIVNEAPIATFGGGTGNATITPTAAAVVTENGTATWGVSTGGLVLLPTQTNCTNCIFTSATAGSKNFTVSIPIADLAPQARPYYSYSVLVN